MSKKIRGKKEPSARVIPMPLPDPLPEPAEMPEWLDDVAKLYWREHEADLTRRGILSAFTQSMFAVLCGTYSQWRRLQEEINRDGLVLTTSRRRRYAHPALSVANQTLRLFVKLAKDFELTPRARRKGAE